MRNIGRFIAVTGAVLAAAMTFGGSAHADVGEIVLTQANGSTILSTVVENVDNVTAPLTIAAREAPGATRLTVQNRTTEAIEVTVDGMSTSVGPERIATIPETGNGTIIVSVPPGT